MTTTTLRAAYSTWVQQDHPTTNWFRKTGYLSLYGVAGRANMGIVWFAPPFPRTGANVVRGTLTLRTRAVKGTGASQITAQLADRWSSHFGTVNWNSRPAGKLAQASAQKANPLGDNTVWQFDVTGQMQAVAAGEPFYGFVLTTQSQHQILVQGNMSAALDPSLEIEWQTNPLPPTDLAPGTGQAVGSGSPVLRWAYRDYVGGDTLAACQVRFGTDQTTVHSAPFFDSGEVATVQPQMDLSQMSGWTAPAQDTVVWWQVRCKDSSGLWSGWSDPVSWQWHPLPAVTLLQPDPTQATMPPTFADPTPPIQWGYSGDMPQARWRVSVQALRRGQWTTIATSGTVIGAETSWTPDKGLATAGLVKIIIDCFDNRARETTPGMPVYAATSGVFQFAPGPNVPVSGLTANPDPVLPIVTLSWTRTEVPDRIDVYRDGALLSSHDGLDWLVSGNSYQMRDAVCPGGPHTWDVYSIVNGKSSPAATVTATVERPGTWLVDEDTQERVWIQGEAKHDMTMPETTVTFQPIGARATVVVTSAQYGYEGTLTGQLVGQPWLPDTETPELWRDRLLAWKADPGHQLRMLTEELDLPVAISEVTVSSTHPWPGERWDVAFKFHQTGRFVFGGD